MASVVLQHFPLFLCNLCIFRVALLQHQTTETELIIHAMIFASVYIKTRLYLVITWFKVRQGVNTRPRILRWSAKDLKKTQRWKSEYK